MRDLLHACAGQLSLCAVFLLLCFTTSFAGGSWSFGVNSAYASDSQQRPAVFGPNVRLEGQYTHRIIEDVPDQDQWNTVLRFGAPFDFGLTDNQFLKQFGWNFSASYQRTEDVLNQYGFGANVFWRDPDAGYIQIGNRVSFTDVDNGVPTIDRHSTTYKLIPDGRFFLGNFTIGARGTYSVSDEYESYRVGGFARYFIPGEIFQDNLSVRLAAGVGNVDYDNGNDFDMADVSVRAQWLLFPDSPIAVSLYAGAYATTQERTAGLSNRETFGLITGFILWGGEKTGSLMERSRTY